MDALLSTFLAALLAEQGDAMQLLAVLAVVRFGARPAVVAGLALAAILNAGLAATAGAGVHLLVPYRATLLLTALALISAGGGALFAARPPKVVIYDRLGPFAATLVAAFVLGFGDKTQFLTFALAARSDAPILAGIGAAAGTIVGLIPALALGPGFARAWPARPLRYGAAALFLVTGLAIGLATLRLI